MPPKASTKKVAASNVKTPRAKTHADKVYNARRRAKRAKARLEKRMESGKMTAQEIDEAQKFVSALDRGIEASYAKKTKKGVRYSDDIDNLKDALNSAAELADERTDVYTIRQEAYEQQMQGAISPAEKKRIDAIWKRNINQATKKHGVSPLDAEEVRMFFRVTQRFWNQKGVSMGSRLEKIVKDLGVRTIQEAFELVVQNKYVQEALEKMKSLEDGSLDEYDERYKYVERLINKVSSIFSMGGNPFTYENMKFNPATG